MLRFYILKQLYFCSAKYLDVFVFVVCICIGFWKCNVLFVSVNLSGAGRVDMSNFDMLKVLGTGGKLKLVELFVLLYLGPKMSHYQKPIHVCCVNNFFSALRCLIREIIGERPVNRTIE